ncbi:MAG: hypothetical protein CME70_07445 [Halobacteriovorax sp.]|nr:hypothetical protein [Halobacteriovorax sp.]|tara:strand:+ start:352704 stop:353072 length:369 start_codon:yes stop_codon:yes gene_type:complete
MPLRKRINLKIFVPLSLVTTTGLVFFSQSTAETLVILGVYVATLLNLFLLMSVIQKIVEIGTATEPVDYSKIKLALIFVAKMAVIFLALTIGVHFTGKRIIIPLLNYVIQIFVLGVSLKRSN